MYNSYDSKNKPKHNLPHYSCIIVLRVLVSWKNQDFYFLVYEREYMENTVSDKQVKLLTDLSEQKNSSKDHAEIIKGLNTMNGGQAKFFISKLMSQKALNSLAVFTFNQRISNEGPSVYEDIVEEDNLMLSGVVLKHKLKIFKEGDIADKALIYIDLNQIGGTDLQALKSFMSKEFP